MKNMNNFQERFDNLVFPKQSLKVNQLLTFVHFQ